MNCKDLGEGGSLPELGEGSYEIVSGYSPSRSSAFPVQATLESADGEVLIHPGAGGPKSSRVHDGMVTSPSLITWFVSRYRGELPFPTWLQPFTSALPMAIVIPLLLGTKFEGRV